MRQAEVVHATSAVGGLPAEAASCCQQALQLRLPREEQERGTDCHSFLDYHVIAAAAQLVGNRIKLQPQVLSDVQQIV